jgi:arabinose-5-phosphate isomerase
VNTDSHLKNALEVIDTEIAAITEIKGNLGEEISCVVKLLVEKVPPGKLVVMGMGKSGHIGKKIAASFASTGTPSFFVHPAEAGHGDLGMIVNKDVVLAISQSGRSDEFNTIISYIKRNGICLVTMTAGEDSPLACASDIVINTKISKEACPLGLAPTASSTVSVVLGDAIAMSCMKARGFNSNDYALTHPHGSLGRKLLMTVSDVMSKGEEIPVIELKFTIKEALVQISSKGMGFGIAINHKNKAVGVFTDGDLRRALDQDLNINKIIIEEIINKKFSAIRSNCLAVEAVQLMETKKVSALPVIDDGEITGAINMRQLLQAGVV